MRVSKTKITMLKKAVKWRYKFYTDFCRENDINYGSFKQYLHIRMYPDCYDSLFTRLIDEYKAANNK